MLGPRPSRWRTCPGPGQGNQPERWRPTLSPKANPAHPANTNYTGARRSTNPATCPASTAPVANRRWSERTIPPAKEPGSDGRRDSPPGAVRLGNDGGGAWDLSSQLAGHWIDRSG